MPAPTLIASRANPRVKQLRAAFAGHDRLSGGLIAIEGQTLLYEALRSGLAIKTIFLSARTTAPAWLPLNIELIELTEEVFSSAVDTQSPQGIAALLVPPASSFESLLKIVISTEGAKRRSGETRNSPATTTPLLLIAAALQDPGNLGTLIRSAEAFGATAILTTPGTVSQWNQKAIRASAGSVFRIPVLASTLTEIASLAIKSGAPGLASETWEERHRTQPRLHLYAAVADDPLTPNTVPVAEANLTQPCALMIGNEGAGLSQELLALADTRITIPTPGRIESLNAAIAGSLLLYEAARQRSVFTNH